MNVLQESKVYGELGIINSSFSVIKKFYYGRYYLETGSRL